MANVNVVLLAGNLTRDPEVRYTPSGLAIAKLGLAVNRKYKDNQGQLKEQVTFVDVDLFGRSAEVAGQYLTKGRPVLIEGELRLDQWEDKQTGQKRSKLKVAGSRFHFLGGGPAEGGAGGGGGGAGAARRPPAQARPAQAQEEAPPMDAPADADLEIPEDDIPF